MGQNVQQRNWQQQDFSQFSQVLYQQLDQLKQVLKHPTFGQEPLKLGAELELYLVDNQGEPLCINQQVLADLNDEQFTPELNQYNIELNLAPVLQTASPFSALKAELDSKLAKLAAITQRRGGHAIPIGILPTLTKAQLTEQCMTPLERYRCLGKFLRQQRGSDFSVNINGKEPLKTRFSNICAEGANTSFQLHLMLKPEQFSAVFNAAQLTLPLITAIGANSPIFLGHQLWDETRIALFKQSIDVRHASTNDSQQPARVSYGCGWLRDSVWQLFAEAIALYPPIIPMCFPKQTRNGLPKLHELSLHMGTLWPWHRPVYDHHGNGHMRIEFRAIPSGPSVEDMLANAAFAIGLAVGMQKHSQDIIAIMPFKYAEYNFYRAAQHGLEAQIFWPLYHKYQLHMTPISEVIASCLQYAHQGLADIGISEQERNYYLGIIENRLQHSLTGARWQRKTLDYFLQHHNKEDALHLLTKHYLQQYQSHKPLHQWERIWM
ncbi:hypothetical protein [Thalassotalea maritima]|uniref:hypothetical protein n=1 Tax=Thalassotalea maritima TaxID=3242416 RepID=UPI00352990FF